MRRHTRALLSGCLVLGALLGCFGLEDPYSGGSSDPGGLVSGCDEGFGVATDGRSCLPRGACLPNAHEEGGQCRCDYGHEPAEDDLSCVPVCGARQHVEGGRCVCDALTQPSLDGSACIPAGTAVYPTDGAVTVADESVVVTTDVNGDGVLNPGEWAKLAVDLRNTGAERISGPITVDLRAESPYVAWCGPYCSPRSEAASEPIEVTFDGCDPGERCPVSGALGLRVAADAPAGTLLTFVLDAPRANLEPLGASPRFSLLVHAADTALAVAEPLAIRDDSNRDGVLGPGETAYLGLELVNHGTAAVEGDIVALFWSDSPYVTWCGPYCSPRAEAAPEPIELHFEGCEGGEACVLAGGRIGLQIAEDAPPGATIPFQLTRIVDGLEQPHPDLTFQLPVFRPDATLAVRPELRISQDTNGDGALSPGETARLGFDLVNHGTAAVEGAITLLFWSDSPHVTWCGPYCSPGSDAGQDPVEVRFEGCESGQPCPAAGGPLGVVVDPAAPAGAPLTFRLTRVVDGLGQSHPDLTLPLPVYRADTVLTVAEPVAVQDDTNEDGVLQPGETAHVALALRNAGTARAVEPLTATLASDSPYAAWCEGWCTPGSDAVAEPIEVAFDECDAGAECRLARGSFGLRVADDAPPGTRIAFTLTGIEDGLGQSHPDLAFTLTVP